MMSSVRKAQVQFDYAALESPTRRFVLERTERIHSLARMTATGIVQIGQHLTEVKARLKHGNFLKWIDQEFGWSDDSARRFMQVHECFKNRNLRNLQIDVSALYLIAAPSMPEPVRAETMRRAGDGEIVSHQGVRALARRFQETGEIPDVQVSLPQMIAQGRRALGLPAPEPPARATPEDIRLRQEMKENTERNVALMGLVRSIEGIAHTPLTINEIARHIERFDTPDVDWKGAIQQALIRLKELATELRQ